MIKPFYTDIHSKTIRGHGSSLVIFLEFKRVIIFLSSDLNICFESSEEPSQ